MSHREAGAFKFSIVMGSATSGKSFDHRIPPAVWSARSLPHRAIDCLVSSHPETVAYRFDSRNGRTATVWNFRG